jgi:hypothetical protein
MSNLLDELVFRVQPVSMAMLEWLGEQVLTVLTPGVLDRPMSLDVLRLVDHELQSHGIDVVPASSTELGPREAATDIGSDGRIMILLNERQFDDLTSDGPAAYRSRATTIHELSHAILHMPAIRQWRQMRQTNYAFNRLRRRDLRAYEDPEWQAWALAGCILMPRRTIMMIEPRTLSHLSRVYKVSEDMVRSHLRRLRIEAIQMG